MTFHLCSSMQLCCHHVKFNTISLEARKDDHKFSLTLSCLDRRIPNNEKIN